MFILRLESCQKYFQENCAFRDRVNPILKESTFDSIRSNSGVTNDVKFICVLCVLYVLKFYALSFFLMASPGGSSQCDWATKKPRLGATSLKKFTLALPANNFQNEKFATEYFIMSLTF